VAAGYALALDRGVRAFVRCAPAFAGILSGTAARAPTPVPVTREGVLVVCGSYVPTSTRQLAALVESWPASFVAVEVSRPASAEAELEIARAAKAASAALERTGVAILVTSRKAESATVELDQGLGVAQGLALAARDVRPRAGIVVAKGGIT